MKWGLVLVMFILMTAGSVAANYAFFAYEDAYVCRPHGLHYQPHRGCVF